MRVFITEYGRVIIACVLSAMLLILLSITVFGNGSHNIQFIYKTHSLYSNYDSVVNKTLVGSESNPMDAIFAISNVVDDSKAPHFTVGDLNTVIAILDSSAKERTFSSVDEIRNLFMQEKVNVAGVDPSKISITVIEYTPTVIPGTIVTENGVSVKDIYTMENYDARDRYGSRIRLTDLTFLQSERVKYTRTLYTEATGSELSIIKSVQNPMERVGVDKDGNEVFEPRYNGGVKSLNPSEFKINQDLPCKYKVIYRYDDGALKCEYTEIFRNDIRTEYQRIYEYVEIETAAETLSLDDEVWEVSGGSLESDGSTVVNIYDGGYGMDDSGYPETPVIPEVEEESSSEEQESKSEDAEEPSSEESGVENSSMAESTPEESSIEESTPEESSVAESVPEDSSIEESSVTESTSEEPSVEKSSSEEPSVEGSAPEESGEESSSENRVVENIKDLGSEGGTDNETGS